MQTQFLDGIGNAANNISSLVNAGANLTTSVANIVSASKGTGVNNPTVQTVIPTTAQDTTALLQQQLLMQQMQNSNNNSGGLSTGAMVGITVGVVAVGGLIIYMVTKD